ncbi:MAG TPA: hypothetical protein VFG65_03565 [Fimbriimonadales bacterium]|jgi:hypothetical protein|nr:hypothetical protein [Fimbriimonadales bacterium]
MNTSRLSAAFLGSVILFSPFAVSATIAGRPLHATLTHGMHYEGYDDGGTHYTAFTLSAIDAKYSVTHETSHYFMDHNSGSRFESDQLVELTITDSSVHALFDGTWYSYSDGAHGSEPGTFEVSLERIPLTKDWMINDGFGSEKLNDSHWEKGGGGYDGFTSEGICRVW